MMAKLLKRHEALIWPIFNVIQEKFGEANLNCNLYFSLKKKKKKIDFNDYRKRKEMSFEYSHGCEGLILILNLPFLRQYFVSLEI